MHSPFSVLGIEPTSNARDVKRAYAAKLKTTRPEDDPAGFQQLREAYDAALEWAEYLRNEEANQIAEVLKQQSDSTEQKPSQHNHEERRNEAPEPQSSTDSAGIPYFSISASILPLAPELKLDANSHEHVLMQQSDSTEQVLKQQSDSTEQVLKQQSDSTQQLAANPAIEFSPMQPVVLRARDEQEVLTQPSNSTEQVEAPPTNPSIEDQSTSEPVTPREFALDGQSNSRKQIQALTTHVQLDDVEMISDHQIAIWLDQFRLREHGTPEAAYAELRDEAMFQSLAVRERLEFFAQQSLLAHEPWHWTALLAFEKSFDWHVVGNLPPANVQQQLAHAHMFHRLHQIPPPTSRFARNDEAMTYRLMRPLKTSDRYLLTVLPGAGASADRVFSWLRESGFEPQNILNAEHFQFWARVNSLESSWVKYGISMWRTVFICFLLALIPGITARNPGLMAFVFFGLSINAIQVSTLFYVILQGVRWLQSKLSR
jgi:hypothetical protein